MSEATLILSKIDALQTKIDRLERRLWLQDKAAYTQEEIVEAMGLSWPQRSLLDTMKKSKILHSPISKSPLTYPGEVVRQAIDKVSAGRVKI